MLILKRRFYYFLGYLIPSFFIFLFFILSLSLSLFLSLLERILYLYRCSNNKIFS